MSHDTCTGKFGFIRSDEGITLEMSAFQIVEGGNSTFINTFDKTKFPVSLSHRRSTTVSLETRNLFSDIIKDKMKLLVTSTHE